MITLTEQDSPNGATWTDRVREKVEERSICPLVVPRGRTLVELNFLTPERIVSKEGKSVVTYSPNNRNSHYSSRAFF